MSAPPLDHDTILRAILQLPRAEQIALAREILRVAERSREPETSTLPPPKQSEDSWARLVGALASDQPPPTDEEIDRWREERRIERYGR